jgi:hypothetical protein
MKNKIVGICVMTLLIGTVVSQVSACTGFTYDDENNVFACHNEDWHDFFNIRFFPASEGKFGSMFFEVLITLGDGSEIMYPFSGMNDQGLWYCMYATPYLLPVNSSDKPTYYDLNSYYKIHPGELCLAECSTIEETIDIIDNYNLEAWFDFQVLIADSTGNSAIIEGDDIIYKEGDFQVVTNFLQTRPELGDLGNSFERYDIVVGMLENMTEPSVEYFTDICNATHAEGSRSWTCHSMICDLSNQIMYLYYSGDYEKQVVIDLNDELEQGEHYYYLGSFFEPDGNQPPDKPEPPTGNESGTPGEDIEYRVIKTSDPDGDKISYLFDWGDGNESFWLYKSMGSIKSSHSWTERGTYEIKVKARDEYGKESEWSDPLVVSMPKTRQYINTPFLNFLENHPYLFPLLRQLLDL